jgi:hypothetical protein
VRYGEGYRNLGGAGRNNSLLVWDAHKFALPSSLHERCIGHRAESLLLLRRLLILFNFFSCAAVVPPIRGAIEESKQDNALPNQGTLGFYKSLYGPGPHGGLVSMGWKLAMTHLATMGLGNNRPHQFPL